MYPVTLVEPLSTFTILIKSLGGYQTESSIIPIRSERKVASLYPKSAKSLSSTILKRILLIDRQLCPINSKPSIQDVQDIGLLSHDLQK